MIYARVGRKKDDKNGKNDDIFGKKFAHVRKKQ
jgi:hypothetical protein